MTNYGRMIYTFTKGPNCGTVNLYSRCSNIYSAGTICLTNATWLPHASIQGNGCDVVQAGSTLAMLTMSFENQTIYSTDQTSRFVMTDASALNKNIKIVGFGKNNSIAFKLPIKSWSYYDNGTLILRDVSRKHIASCNIGPGHDVSLFS